jgi:hypothetical protein
LAYVKLARDQGLALHLLDFVIHHGWSTMSTFLSTSDKEVSSGTFADTGKRLQALKCLTAPLVL